MPRGEFTLRRHVGSLLTHSATGHRIGRRLFSHCDRHPIAISKVDALIEDDVIRRVLALVEVSYSNSIVEAYWRSLKNQWLFLNALDSFEAVEKLIAFHLDQHNSVMPHSAFWGQTPDEVYFGRGGDVVEELAAARRAARQARLVTNRALACSACAPENSAKSEGLQVHLVAP